MEQQRSSGGSSANKTPLLTLQLQLGAPAPTLTQTPRLHREQRQTAQPATLLCAAALRVGPSEGTCRPAILRQNGRVWLTIIQVASSHLTLDPILLLVLLAGNKSICLNQHAGSRHSASATKKPGDLASVGGSAS